MDYMDHWAEQSPAPTVERKYKVGMRVVGGEGTITVTVNAVSWEQAHTKAFKLVEGNMRVSTCEQVRK